MKKIKINLSIYSENSIRMAIKAYQEYAFIFTKRKRDYMEVIFLRCKYDEELTTREFENYMIGIENS